MKETKKTETEALIVDTDYSVLVIEKNDLQAFFLDPAKLDALYAHVEKMARGLVADPLTKDGASQIKSCARQIASVKKRIDDIGKEVVADLKKMPGQIDANRKDLRERLEALQDDIRRPVTEIENREDEIDGIKGLHFNLATADSEQIKKEIDFVRSIPLTEDKWHESLEKAKAAIDAELKALELMKGAAEKREQEARELEELRKKQEEADRIIREQKIREEAERKAREEAEARAAADKARLEREKQEAERKAEEAEKARLKAEEKARNSNDATDRVAIGARQSVPMSKTPPQPKPSKWTDEQKAVNNAIVAEIARLIATKLEGFTQNGYELAAREVVKAIVKGQINNLRVEY